MTAITVAIVDDHPLFREGVGAALSRLGFDIVGTGSTREDAVAIAEQRRPDIMLVDISMPGGGLEAIHPILSKNSLQKIVVLTVSEFPEDATRALNSGARGYILKGVGARSLADSLTSVVAGETYVSPTLAAKMFSALKDISSREDQKHPLDTLTTREFEILTLVASGMSNKHVALQLDLQEKTVKYHMTKVLSKLNAPNRTAAAMLLRQANPINGS